jgi:uncharacterized membrane protein (UPF0136 family)
MKSKRSFPLILIMILSFEKFIQHMVVTYAFMNDLSGIREFVSHDYRIFMTSGFLVGILYLISLFLLIQRKRIGLNLLLFLALFDFFGEFIAQGTLAIEITVSFLVASLIIILVITTRRQLIENGG